MGKQLTALWITIGLILSMTGCGSSPAAKFYTITALDRNLVTPALIKTGKDITVRIGPVTIPDTLQKPQIVSRTGENMLVLDEFNRWGGDLQSDFQRILGENISILLPTEHIILNQELTPLPVDFQVIVYVREFDGKLGGVVTLNADWTVVHLKSESTGKSEKSLLQENTEGARYQEYVSAQSRLLAKLSHEIANEISRQLQVPAQH